jgi:hypothetical protein
MASDGQEGIGAFLEKRNPVWRGRWKSYLSSSISLADTYSAAAGERNCGLTNFLMRYSSAAIQLTGPRK